MSGKDILDKLGDKSVVVNIGDQKTTLKLPDTADHLACIEWAGDIKKADEIAGSVNMWVNRLSAKCVMACVTDLRERTEDEWICTLSSRGDDVAELVKESYALCGLQHLLGKDDEEADPDADPDADPESLKRFDTVVGDLPF